MAIDLNLKSLNNIPWYGQLGIFSVFGIIIAGLGWYFFISGLSEQIAVKQGQLDGLKVEIQRGQAVEQKHQEFLTQNKQLLSKLSTLKIILPEAKQTDQLLRQVQESAVASNLLDSKVPATAGEPERFLFGMAHQFRGRWLVPRPWGLL